MDRLINGTVPDISQERHKTQVIPEFDIADVDPEWAGSGRFSAPDSVIKRSPIPPKPKKDYLGFLKAHQQRLTEGLAETVQAASERTREVVTMAFEAVRDNDAIRKVALATKNNIGVILFGAAVVSWTGYSVRSCQTEKNQSAYKDLDTNKTRAIFETNLVLADATTKLENQVSDRNLLPDNKYYEFGLKIESQTYELAPALFSKELELVESEKVGRPGQDKTLKIYFISDIVSNSRFFLIKDQEGFLIQPSFPQGSAVSSEGQADHGQLYFLFSPHNGKFQVQPVFLFGLGKKDQQVVGKLLENDKTEVDDPQILKKLKEFKGALKNFEELKSRDPRLDQTRPAIGEVLSSQEIQKKLVNATVHIAMRLQQNSGGEAGFNGFIVAPDTIVIPRAGAQRIRDSIDPENQDQSKEVIAGVDHFVPTKNNTIMRARILSNPPPVIYSIQGSTYGVMTFMTPFFKKGDEIKISYDPFAPQSMITLEPCNEKYFFAPNSGLSEWFGNDWEFRPGMIRDMEESSLTMGFDKTCGKNNVLIQQGMPIINVKGEVVSFTDSAQMSSNFGYRVRGPAISPADVESLRQSNLKKLKK